MPAPKPKPARRAKPAKPAKAATRVYTFNPPPRASLSRGAPNWDTATTTQAALAHVFAYHLALGRGSAIAPDGTNMTDWWHAAMAARDAECLAALQSAIDANNDVVRALASPLALGVDVHTIARPAALPEALPHAVLQFDAGEMARRIEMAAAKHKNRGPRNHKGANRHLKYLCPTCGSPARASQSDRVLMCSGTFSRTHEPALMQFDESSQPAYRLEDKYGLADPSDNPEDDIDRALAGVNKTKGHHKTTSQYRLDRAPTPIPLAPAAPAPSEEPNPNDPIPF